MTFTLRVPDQQDLKPRIIVFGVGGAGGNAVDNMIMKNLEGANFVVANTDAQALQQSSAQRKIQMGVKITEGLGAGAKPEIGTLAAEESLEEVIEALISVYGIGRWTAEMFLIFSLNRVDVLPLGDLGLKAGIKKIYNMRNLPSPKRMLALGKKWHPMETVATWYAWRIQDDEIITY